VGSDLTQAGAERKAPAGLATRRRARKPGPIPQALAFPNPNDIQIGLDRGTLLATFGQPALKTTSIQQNRIVETFLYVSRDRNRATSVVLRDGVVISASTSTY
jgi:hypothetical protein